MKKKLIEKHEFRGLQSKFVSNSNVITRSAQSLSLVEKRILMAALAQTGGISRSITLSAKEYAETFELNNIDTAYQELSDAARRFMSRSFIIYPKPNDLRDQIQYNWLSHVHYHKNQGVIDIQFNPNIHNLLFDLTEQFTKYQLKQASTLRSIHSWRLLELLEQMRQSEYGKEQPMDPLNQSQVNSEGWLKMSIDEFNHAMNTPESYRRNFKDLRKWVIEPAVKELNEKDGWNIEWVGIKEGRRYTYLEFNFNRNTKISIFKS